MAKNLRYALFSSFNGFLCQNGGSTHSVRRLSGRIDVHTYAHIVYRTAIICKERQGHTTYALPGAGVHRELGARGGFVWQ